MQNSNTNKNTRIAESLTISIAALAGSIVASLIIGLLGVLLVTRSYPNSEFERGAAIVGAILGSSVSILAGFLVGGGIALLIFYLLLKLNARRSALVSSGIALLISMFVSALFMVPVGFIFFALGHI